MPYVLDHLGRSVLISPQRLDIGDAAVDRLAATDPRTAWTGAGRRWALEKATLEQIKVVARAPVAGHFEGEAAGRETGLRIIEAMTTGAGLPDLWQLTEEVTGRVRSTPTFEEAQAFAWGARDILEAAQDRLAAKPKIPAAEDSSPSRPVRKSAFRARVGRLAMLR